MQPGLDSLFFNVATSFEYYLICSEYFDILQKNIFDHNKYFCRSLERDLERLKADHATEVKDQIIIRFMYCTMILRLDDDSSIYLSITSFYLSLS